MVPAWREYEMGPRHSIGEPSEEYARFLLFGKSMRCYALPCLEA